MLLLRPRASFKSGQARLRNLIPYYSHRGSFQEEPPPTQLSSQERKHDQLPVVTAATLLEDPILFIEKNSCRGTGHRRRGSEGESSCEERMDEDEDSLVEDDDSLVVSSLSDDTFSSEIFLELARTTSRDINANMRLVSDTTTVGPSCFAAAASSPRSLVGTSQGSGLQSCSSSECQQLGGSSCHLGSAEGIVCSRSSSSSCFAEEDCELVDGSSSWGRTAER